MLSCFAGCGICGLKGAQRRQSTPDAASEPKNEKVTPAISDSPESASTRASTVETAPIRKRDVIRQKLFGAERTSPKRVQVLRRSLRLLPPRLACESAIGSR
eukprot:TRINITY_DN1956_c0_g1_i1.p2 TRINITY_DN1956_c0_g1~~TRINITY_DN1956_c0_g1_i1.p2  ORF type:complete len:102 (-),score=9.22 TRINITY_DN1956_c0_g1_i1:342-647(-)